MTTKAFAQLPRLRSHYNDCSRRAFDERALLFGVVAHEGNLEEWNSPALCPPGTGPTRLRQKASYKIVGVWEEIASGAKHERAQRRKVLALAQARKFDAILVTELNSWGRSVLNVL